MHLIISQVLLPFLIGTGVIFLLKQPGITNLEMVVDSSMAFLLLPVILRARVANDLFFDEEPRKIRLHWKWILATILALVIFRILFWKGIRL
jgi:branched-subunit amino acid transport protein